MSSAAGEDAPPITPLAHRAAFGAVLSLAMGIGTFPGYVFGVLGPQLIEDFSLSRSQLGLATALFFIVGGLGSLPAGPIVDRLGGRRVMIAALACLGFALLGMAAAPTYGWLLTAAAVAGLSLATGNPTTNKLIALQLPPGRRGVTMGFKQAGVQVGAFLAGAVLAPAAALWGWRPVLATSTVVPAVAVVAVLRLIPADARLEETSAAEARGPLPRAVRRLAVYAFLMGAGAAAVNAYLPLFVVERLSLSAPVAGAVVALVGLVGIVGRVVWGWASERLPTFTLPLAIMAIGACVAIALMASAPALGTAWIWVAAALFGATAVTWNAVGMLALLAEVGSADAGRASGYVLFGFYLGFVPSPVVFGAIVDRTGSYTLAWIVTLAVFAAAAVVVLRQTFRHSQEASHPPTPAS